MFDDLMYALALKFLPFFLYSFKFFLSTLFCHWDWYHLAAISL